MISEKILEALIQGCGFEASQPLIVGVSGGPDSLALAHCLWKADIPIIVGHFDHGLRPTSGQDAEHVQSLMQSWEVPCEVGKVDVRDYAREHKLGIEEAARICRYLFLLGLAEARGAAGVAVGHTADDQVETVLMHFLRGAGITGLRGMQAVSFQKELNPHIPILRPMLEVSHAEVLAYCQELRLLFLSDESNQDPSFFRNRLRLEVIPLLEQVNPAFKRVVLRNTLALQSDASLLEQLEEQAFEACLRSKQENSLQLDLGTFLSLAEGLQRRVLMHALNTLVPGLRNIGYEAVERVRKAIHNRQNQVDFLANVKVWVNHDTIQLGYRHAEADFQDFPQLPLEKSYALNLGEPLQLANGWFIEAELVSQKVYVSLPIEVKQDRQHAWLNPVDLLLPMEVRAMHPGERWAPLGMQGKHQKLSDFFINEKIPQGARPKWPLVLSEGSILWVCGLRISQAWRLIGDEPEILHLHLVLPKR
jgi:tRNA(Ile)-lysidine synthase